MGSIIEKERAIKETLRYLTKKEISYFLDRLKHIKDASRRNNSKGICGNLYHSSFYERMVLRFLFKSWQYYSGNEDYPVERTAEIYQATENKWEGKYGWKRKRLLQHCINILTDALHSK